MQKFKVMKKIKYNMIYYIFKVMKKSSIYLIYYIFAPTMIYYIFTPTLTIRLIQIQDLNTMVIKTIQG
jgi:transposase